MADADTTAGGDPPLDPEEVSDRTFATAFRGFDPVQVRSFLGLVSDELRRLNDQEAVLRRTLEGMVPSDHDESLLAKAQADAARIVEEAKAEADRLVREAKDRVATLGSAATAETTRVIDEAKAEAARIRAGATDDLKSRVDDAEGTAVRKIAEAEREAAALRVQAREEAEATVEAARERGRSMVAEAQAARERMLADLAKRKRAAQSQLEQMRAARDRLLDTLKVARRSIDEMTTRFDAADGGPSSSALPSAGAPSSMGEGSRPRPVRTRAVTIGEAPVAAPRPHITAPLAQDVAGEQGRAAGTHDSAPTPVPSVHRPTDAEREIQPVAPRALEEPPTGERRSSSLRILRRNKAQPPPISPEPPIGRESHGEGIRIIGRPSAEPPDREPVGATMPEGPSFVEREVPLEGPHGEPVEDHRVGSESAGGFDPPENSLPSEAEPADVGRLEDEVPEAYAGADESAEVDPPPLQREDIRPRIEDLFARIRADREATTTSARTVLGLAEAADSGDASAEPLVATGRTSDADEDRLQARDSVIEPLAHQLTKRLKRALQDEQNASLDRLRTSRGTARVDQVLARRDDQALPYRNLSGPFLEEAARAGASTSPHGAIAVPIADLATQLADDLTGALRSRLDTVLATAASDNLDLSSLSDRIGSVYREWKTQKVERLAVHYLIAAHERGGFMAYPEGTPLRWIVDDGGPCPDCDDNALAGITPRGQNFPTGQLHPPAHVGCRCLLVSTPT